MSKKQADILSLNTVEESAKGYDLDIVDGNGASLGFSLTIIGKHSDAVTHWVNKLVNKAMLDQSVAQRKGKPVAVKTMEEIKRQNIDGALVRVVGWKEVNQEFSKDILRTVLEKNPPMIDQIVDASDDLGNFTKTR